MLPNNWDQIEDADVRELFVKAHDYDQLKASPGWKRLLGFLNDVSEAALAKMSQNKSSDASIALAYQSKWQIAENLIEALTSEVEGTIALRDQRLEEIETARRAQQEAEQDYLQSLQ